MIEALQSESPPDSPFGPHMEAGIISLILDFPELYVPTSKFITTDLFSRPEVKFVIAAVKQDYDKFGVIPSRNLLHDRLAKSLSVADPYEEILAIVDRESDPREAPILRQTLREWVEHRSYDQLYSDEALAAHQRGDHEILRKIVDSATSISMVGQHGFWFFDQIDEIFADNAMEHIHTGFPSLDAKLNDGGPSPGEVLIFLAPTGVGKCHSLQSKIIEKDLSRIFDLELEDGSIIKLAGFQEVQTARGRVKVHNLAAGDDITEIPTFQDAGDITL
jgi:hypothetical protein